ncbi:hypothetical protein KSP40_PGU018733 [Platanthera guangdongensis]|uniref:SWIM-type domain-containing protein n=1 Tax=Platanthera guangdongensis TaxID=2320717 RepID=A0ABR2MXL2_9ASPA
MASSASIAVADSVWRQMKSSRSGLVSRCSLHFLFGKNFERATIIVDQGGVKRVSGNPSCRVLFLVAGESKEEYLCFPEHFCTCHSFFFDVVNKGEQLCCKHQIAVQLAESVGAYKEISISDEELALILCRI